jgi:hypothetical protein
MTWRDVALVLCGVCVVAVVSAGELIDTGDGTLYQYVGGESPAVVLFYVAVDCRTCDEYQREVTRLARSISCATTTRKTCSCRG